MGGRLRTFAYPNRGARRGIRRSTGRSEDDHGRAAARDGGHGVEQTVVSTAMPSIHRQTKGIHIYPWVFSAYLLAATVSTPLYGKLADLLGGSACSSSAWVFAPGLDPLGAGAEHGATDRDADAPGARGGGRRADRPHDARRHVHAPGAGQGPGLFSGVWGVSSLAGPAIGGVLTDQLSWRWVFFVTVPFAIVATWMLVRHLHETSSSDELQPIDWSGRAAARDRFDSCSGPSWTAPSSRRRRPSVLLALAAVLLILFVGYERRAADPVLPIDLFARAHIAAAVGGSFLIGASSSGSTRTCRSTCKGFAAARRRRRAGSSRRSSWPGRSAWRSRPGVVVRLRVPQDGVRRLAPDLLGDTLAGAGGPLAEGLRPILPGGERRRRPRDRRTSFTYTLGVQNYVKWGQPGAATSAVIFFRMIGPLRVNVGMLGPAKCSDRS